MEIYSSRPLVTEMLSLVIHHFSNFLPFLLMGGHFTLKLKIARVSETPAVPSASTECRQPETGSTLLLLAINFIRTWPPVFCPSLHQGDTRQNLDLAQETPLSI